MTWGGLLRGFGLWLALLAAPLWVGAQGLPPAGRCPDQTGADGELPLEDAGPPLLQEGAVLGLADVLSLEQLLPEEVWTYREAFLYEGMRMEIGWCHRRYPVAPFYQEATETFAGRARLDDDGNLEDYVAGLPFPPESIDLGAVDAALRWAWNYSERYRGSGPVGQFRIFDMPDRLGSVQVYEGDFFQLRTGHRADLAASAYQMPESTKNTWVAGGLFREPFDTRHLRWRQFRTREAESNYKKPDDIFVYVPELRKSRRAASAWVDGIYTPQYRVAGQNDAGVIPFGQGGSEYAPAITSIEVGAAKAISVTEDIRRGFTGLSLRANAYDWKLLGTREVLAPLNGSASGWPDMAERNFGPSGLSVASDRWDVRYAVVIEGIARRVVGDVARVTLWIDYQTQQPLYFMTRRKNGFLLDVGILVHRFSGDQPGYPTWPSGEPANVFEPVAAAFYWVPGGGSGWRRESYDARSIPLEPDELRKLTTTDELIKGR